MRYNQAEFKNPDMLIIAHRIHGQQIWSKCKVRKSHICRVTQKRIEKGEQAFRPVTNKSNRMHRISLAGANKIKMP